MVGLIVSFRSRSFRLRMTLQGPREQLASKLWLEIAHISGFLGFGGSPGYVHRSEAALGSPLVLLGEVPPQG